MARRTCDDYEKRKASLTMRNPYTRPTVEIKNWLITENHLKRVHDFIKDRFGVTTVEIQIIVESGNNKEYSSFKDFSRYLENLKSSKEVINEIIVSHAEYNFRKSKKRHIWLSINLQDSYARFSILGEDKDGSVKDWIAGSYEEMQKVAKSLEIEDVDFCRELNKEYGRKSILYKGVIMIDLDGAVKKEIETKLTKSDPKEISSVMDVHIWNKTWWGEIIIGLIIGLVLLTIGIGLYYSGIRH